MLNQKGMSTAVAICIMAFIGIIVAGILPMVSNEIKMAKMDSDGIEAQFAAESGVTKALSALKNLSTTWDWLDKDEAIAKGVSGKVYNVTLTPTIADGLSPTPGTTYTISAIGKIGSGSISRTATASATYTVPGGFPYPVYGRQKLIVDSGVVINGGKAATGAHNNPGQLINNAGIEIVFVDLAMPTIPTTFQHQDYDNGTVLANYPNSGTITLSGNYYVSGDFGTNSGVKLYVPAGSNALIFVKGNISINDEIKADGQLTIIAENDMYINSSDASISGTINLYSKQRMYLNRSMAGTIVAMSQSDLTFNSGIFNKMAAYADNDLTINSGVTLTGTAVANHALTLNGGTINYSSAICFPN